MGVSTILKTKEIGTSSDNRDRGTGLNTEVNDLCMHSMRATAATNALSHEADIAKAQEWIGHPNSPGLAFMVGARHC